MADHEIVTMLVDVRSESDYNLFHIRDARNVPYDQLSTIVEEFHALPQNAVVFVMSNDEAEATEAWKYLLAESVVNVYILDGGVNNWITVFGENAFPSADAALAADDQLDFQFAMAYGDNHVAASPHADRFDLTYEEHVVLSIKRGPASGGCG